MGTAIIIGILAIIVVIAVISSVKHMKGEGGCCGGGGDTVAEEKKTLDNPVIAVKTVDIEGMHCENCKNSIERSVNKIDGRLAASVIFLVVLMYFSMGHMMWGWSLPSVLEGNHVAMGLIQMLLTIIIMVINQHFFISGFKGLLHRSPNMDTLVALGSGAAFVWSTYALLP